MVGAAYGPQTGAARTNICHMSHVLNRKGMAAGADPRYTSDKKRPEHRPRPIARSAIAESL